MAMDALDEVWEARVEGCDVATARAAGAPHAVGASFGGRAPTLQPMHEP